MSAIDVESAARAIALANRSPKMLQIFWNCREVGLSWSATYKVLLQTMMDGNW